MNPCACRAIFCLPRTNKEKPCPLAHLANPILRPQDVPPSRPGFEVIGALNAAAAQLGDETLLLVRVVERPINPDPQMYLSPRFSTRQPGIWC